MRDDKKHIAHAAESKWWAARTSELTSSDRMDPIWRRIVIGAFCVLLAGFTLVFWLLPNDPVEERVVDRRLLGSFTQTSGCFDTVAASAEGMVWVSRKEENRFGHDCAVRGIDKALVVFDPVWRLFRSAAAPFLHDVGSVLPSSLARLGDDLWIRGDQDGLAHLPDGARQWQVRVSQTLLSAEASDIAGVAATGDGRTTYFITSSGDISSYNPMTGVWRHEVPLREIGDVTGLVYAQGALWASGSGGLWRIDPERRVSGEARFDQVVKDTPVSTMKALNDGRVLALTQPDCADKTAGAARGCNRLLLIAADGRSDKPLLDNTEAPNRWGPEDIHFVAGQGDWLVIAGPKGATLYDAKQRMWKPLVSRREILAFQYDGARWVVFGGDRFVARLDLSNGVFQGEQDRADLFTVETISFAPDSVLLTNTRGDLFRMAPDGKLKRLFRPTAPEDVAPSKVAVSTETHDAFIAESGRTVARNVETGRYTQYPSSETLQKLATATQHLTSGGRTYLYRTGAEGAFVARFNPAHPPESKLLDAPGLTDLTLLPQGRALLTLSDGSLHEVRETLGGLSSTPVFTAQHRATGLDLETLTDITRLGGDLVLSGAKGIWIYTPATRIWQKITGESITGVAAGSDGQALYAVDASGRLLQFEGEDFAQSEVLAPARFSFRQDNAILDTLQLGKYLVFLSKDPNQSSLALDIYDTETRAITKYGLGRGEDGQILSFQAPQVWLVRKDNVLLTLNDGEIAPARNSDGAVTGALEADTGFVLSLELDDASGLPFLHRRSGTGGLVTCAFRAVSAPGLEANAPQKIPGIGFLHQHDQTVHVYLETHRRWFDIRLPSDGFNVYVVDGILWALGQNDDVIRVDLSRVPPYAPCSNQRATFLPEKFQNAAITPDKSKILAAANIRGNLVEKRFAGTERSLPFPKEGRPETEGTPLRVLHHQGAIWVAFETHVSRYDIATRNWTKVAEPPSERDWRQVWITPGRGTNTGTMQVTYQDALSASVLSIAIDAASPAQSNLSYIAFGIGQVLKQYDQLGPLQDVWSEGANILIFRFAKGLASYDTSNQRWGPVWELDGETVAKINGRLIAYDPAKGDIKYSVQANAASLVADRPGETTLPEDADLYFAPQGQPVWQTPDGSVRVCWNDRRCTVIDAPQPLLHTAKVTRAIPMFGFQIVLDDQDRAALFQHDSSEMRAVSWAQRSLSGPAAFQPFTGRLWPSRDGNKVFYRDELGRITRYVQGDRLQEPSSRDRRLYNPDDKMWRDTDGLSYSSERTRGTALPADLLGANLVALGKTEDAVWFQTDRALFWQHAPCADSESVVAEPDPDDLGPDAPTLDEAEPEETEPAQEDPSCDLTELPDPGAPIAYIDGALSERGYVLHMQTGANLQLRRFVPRWREVSASPFVPVSSDAFLENNTHQRPDGALSLVVNPIRREAEKIVFTNDDGSEADLQTWAARVPLSLTSGWLAFDAAQGVFRLGSGANARSVPAEGVFDEGGVFLPLQPRQIAAQPDGRLILATDFGYITRSSAALAAPMSLRDRFTPTSWETTRGLRPAPGGFWNGTEFVGASTAPERPQTQRVGALEIKTDDAVLGVDLRHNRQPGVWASGQFAWDIYADHGFTEDGKVVIGTNLGTLAYDAPLSAPVDAQIYWTQDLASLVEKASDLRPSTNADGWVFERAKEHWVRRTDRLHSAVFREGRILISTSAGLARLGAVGAARTFTQSAFAGRLLKLDHETGLAYIDGDDGQRIGLSIRSDVAISPALTKRLNDPLKFRVGPLSVLRAPVNAALSRYQIRLGPETNRPALSEDGFLRPDVILRVKPDDKGGLFLVTKAGLINSGAELGHLADDQISVLHDQPEHLWLTEYDDKIYVQETRSGACRLLSPGLEARCLVNTDGESRVSLDWPKGVLSLRLPARQEGGTALADPLRIYVNPDGPVRQTLATLDPLFGKFSFDRFAQLSFCDNQLHLVDFDGRHSVWESKEARERVSVIVQDRQLTNLHCLKDPTLPPSFQGLWSRSFDGWHAWRGSARGEWSSESSMTSIDVLTKPAPDAEAPVIIVRHDDQAQIRMKVSSELSWKLPFGGQMASVAPISQTSPALRVDTPSMFLWVGSGLWAVTPDGIAPYEITAGGQARLAPGLRPKVEIPAGCVPDHARFVAFDETLLFCENQEAYRLRAASGNGLTLEYAGRADRSWSAQAGPLHLESFAPHDAQNKAGALRGIRFNGEEFEIGSFGPLGFTFDQLHDIELDKSGTLHFTSDEGWMPHAPLPNDRGMVLWPLHSGQKMRMSDSELTRVSDLVLDLSTREVCARDARKGAILISGQAVRGWDGTCSAFWAEDARRVFGSNETRPGAQTLSIILLSVHRRAPANDRLENGRFAADRIKGVPVGQDTEARASCAETGLDGVSMALGSGTARRHIAKEDCIERFSPQAAWADGDFFTVDAERLMRLSPD